MHRGPCSLLVIFLWAGSGAAQPMPEEPLEKAVNKALIFLQQMQDTDGSWRLSGAKSSTATALAVMAFLSAGHVPGEGKYGDLIENGIRSVAEAPQPAGQMGLGGPVGPGVGGDMYALGINTLMLAQAAGMTDAKLAPKVKLAVEQGVKLILKAQRLNGPHKGGWRYSVDGYDADLSVTGWQLLALKAAKNLGCDVPAERIKMAVDYIKASQNKAGGGFHYTLGGPVTVPCTATAVLCLELCDGHHTEAAKRGGAYLLQHPPTWNEVHFFYHVYYCAQATFQLGGHYWDFYKPRIHKLLIEQQNNNGCWLHPTQLNFGPVYATAMSVLALTVEYRYLPIYQRGDD